jgi:hypothetical protein
MKKKLIIEIHKGMISRMVSNVKFDDVIVVDKDLQDNGNKFIYDEDIEFYPYDELYTVYATDCTRDEEIMYELKNLHI